MMNLEGKCSRWESWRSTLEDHQTNIKVSHPHHLCVCPVGHIHARKNKDRRKSMLLDKLEKHVDKRLLSRLRELWSEHTYNVCRSRTTNTGDRC